MVDLAGLLAGAGLLDVPNLTDGVPAVLGARVIGDEALVDFPIQASCNVSGCGKALENAGYAERSEVKEIADIMHLSPKTIEGYRNNIFEKLHLRNRTGLVIYAIKNKIFIP